MTRTLARSVALAALGGALLAAAALPAHAQKSFGGQGGGGGGGARFIGAGIAIGTGLAVAGARAAARSRPSYDRPGQSRPGGKPKDKPKDDDVAEPRRPRDRDRPVRVACLGGRVLKGACVCPPGERRVETGDNRFACRDGGGRKPPIIVVDPAPPRPPKVSRPPVVAETPASRPSAKLPPLKLLPPLLPPPSAGVPARPPLAADAQQVPDEVLFWLPASTPTGVEEAIARRYGLRLIERTTLALVGQRCVRLRIPDRRSVPEVVAALAADPAVGGPQPNYIYRQQQAAARLDDGTLQYALKKVALSDAHALATGRGAVVAVIDTGVDAAHPDLAGSDLVAFDALGGKGKPRETHGTAIAGIIAGRGVTRGIAPSARLLSVRAFEGSGGRAAPRSTSYVILKAIDWSLANGAQVLNLSFAGPRDPLVETAIGAAAARNAILIAAAGNAGRAAPPAYPAAYPRVIAVTATDADDRLYAEANIGPYIALAAPGVDILAPTRDAGHELLSGTSFAAAHVSGIVALMLEGNAGLGADGALAALERGALDLGPPGRDAEYGAGLANATAAVTYAGARAP